jgi:hypothetical protein
MVKGEEISGGTFWTLGRDLVARWLVERNDLLFVDIHDEVWSSDRWR